MGTANILPLIFLCCNFFGPSFQQDKRKFVKILHASDSKNTVAQEAVDAALAYYNKKEGGSVTLIRVNEGSTKASTILHQMCRVYAKTDGRPDVVLDTTTTGPTSQLVKLVTRSLGLPTLSASYGDEGDLVEWRQLDKMQKAYLVQILPPVDVIPRIVSFLVNKQKFRNAAILYDSEYDLVHRYISLLLNTGVVHTITPIKSNGQLEELINMGIINFFIMGSIKSISDILTQACDLDVLNEGFSWHVLTQSKGKISNFCENATVVIINPPQSLSSMVDNYNSTSTPELTYAFYFELSRAAFYVAQNMKISPNSSKVTCADYNGTDVINASANITGLFQFNAVTTIYGPWLIKENGESLMPFKMLVRGVRFENYTVAQITNLGMWHASIGKMKNASSTQAFMNFRSLIRFKVAALIQPPFIFPKKTTQEGYKGFCIDLMDEISALSNFKYELYVPEGNTSIQAIVDDIINGTALVGLGSIPMEEENAQFVHYTVPFYKPVGLSVMMKRQNPPESKFFITDIFELKIWMAIVCVFLVSSLLLCGFDRWSPCSYQNNKDFYDNAPEKKQFTLVECLKFCFYSTTPRGGGQLPKSLSGCAVIATWWLFAFIIIGFYVSNLSSFITVSRLERPIESLDDLVGQYKIPYGPVNGSPAMDYIEEMALVEKALYKEWKRINLGSDLGPYERSKYSVFEYPLSDKFTKMWKFINDIELPNTLEEATTWIRSVEGFALIGDKTDLDYLALTSCDFQVLHEEFRRRSYSIVVEKSSPIKNLIDKAITKLVLNGTLEQLRITWWTNNEKAVTCHRGEFSIGNTVGIFVIMAIVLMFSGIVYLIQLAQKVQTQSSRVNTAE